MTPNRIPKHLQSSGMVIAQSQTELHTWFERDRAHVELRESDTDTTIVEWWDEDVAQAIEDGFLSANNYHGTAYAYANACGLLPRIPPHYIEGSGLHGCIYDACGVCRTYADAVESIVQRFELGRTRRAKLVRSGYIELDARKDGAEYAEITVCNCSEPWTHSEDMSEEDWNA